MIENKYKNKKYLIETDLDSRIFEKFNLKVDDVIPMRKVFFLKTNKGDKVLKRINYGLEELKFIYSALQYIRKSFSEVINFVKTEEGEIYKIWKGEVYCIMDAVEGRECEYTNPVDVKIASIGLANFHRASEGFKGKKNNRYYCGSLIDAAKRKGDELYFFKSIANLHEKKSEFDLIFLDHVEYYNKDVERAIKLLENLPYYKLCSEEDKMALCHHDLAHHNILIKEEKAHFIDFDYAIMDLKVHDLCNFINPVIKKAIFDIDKAKLILEEYSKINPLTAKEIEVLMAMLVFPNDFYSISRDYYTKRKDWEEEVFLDRLIRKVEYKEEREEFLEQFKEWSKS